MSRVEKIFLIYQSELSFALDPDGFDDVDGFAAFQIARDISDIALAAQTPGISPSEVLKYFLQIILRIALV